MLRPSAAGHLAREARLEHTPHELVEVDLDRAGGHGHETVTRHARNGVDFEEQRAPRGIRHEIRPTPTRGTDGVEGGEREVGQVLLSLARQSGGTVVPRVIAEILRLVVVEGLRRLDPDRGQRPALQNGDRVFLAR